MRKNAYGKEKLKSTLYRFMDSATLKDFIRHLQNVRHKEGQTCPHCKSHHVVRYGQYRGRQRYKCKNCDKTFNDFTNTPLHRTHYPEKWIKFFELVLKGSSLYKAHQVLKVSYTTVFYWRHKLLYALQTAEHIQLPLEKIQPYWNYSLISFRRHSIPIYGLLFDEQKNFQKWMSYFDWIAVKYIGRYLAWFRFYHSTKPTLIEERMKELFIFTSSVYLDQTYESVKAA